MKAVILPFLLIISISASAKNYECIEPYLEKKIIFAFNDGDLHQMTLVRNDFGVVTAIYGKYGGEVFYSNYVNCNDSYEMITFLKPKNDRGRYYRHPIHIELPKTIVSGSSEAKIDLRWLYFYDPLPFIFLDK